ncbi:MAG: HAMP domain-containing protein [Candidatus Handelsmanbacteria bacterium]|nr:HAMP domain-containing protein [Candidatus Handelsmanbacteria bacterium]
MKGRIQNRFLAALLAAAALPLAGVGVYSIYTHTEALRQLALAAARERVQLKARKVDEVLHGIRDDLSYLSGSPVLLGLLDTGAEGPERWHEEVGRHLLAFAQNKPLYTCLRYLDESGRELVRAENDGLRLWLVPPDQLEDRRHQDYFWGAALLPPGVLHVSGADPSDGDCREPVVRYALRVADRHNRKRGVLVADLFARKLVEAARQTSLSPQEQTSLLDAKGRPLSPIGEVPLRGRNLVDLRAQLLAGLPAVIEQGEQTFSWAAVWPAGLPGAPPLWLLVDVAPGEAVFASVERFRWVFAGVVALALAAALLLSLLLARRIAGPLAQLRDGARRIAGGAFAHRLEVHTDDEIGELAEEFNHMGQALQETYRRLEERDAVKTEKLNQMTHQLIESKKLAAVGQLAAGVAHEINNPAGVVSMFAQQLQERPDLDPAHRDKLRVIERHAERIGRVTRGLLDFARAREYRRDPLDLCQTLDQALEAFAPRLKQVEVAKCYALCPAPVLGDGEQLQQVFGNLILNAVQAMEGKGRLWVEVVEEADQIRAAVADSGPGIPAQYLERVFEPFFTTKEVGQGTGLGLAVSYGTVKAHGGRMSAANRPQGGAVFSIFLPRVGKKPS